MTFFLPCSRVGLFHRAGLGGGPSSTLSPARGRGVGVRGRRTVSSQAAGLCRSYSAPSPPTPVQLESLSYCVNPVRFPFAHPASQGRPEAALLVFTQLLNAAGFLYER
jgi:hypothetical protein